MRRRLRTERPECGGDEHLDALNAIETRVKLPVALAVLGSLLWILMATATVIESDTYRYATVLLTLIGGYYSYTRLSFVRMHWAGWLCIAWTLYAVARFLLLIYSSPDRQRGASEWLYFFPLFFPFLGAALVVYRPYVSRILAGYFVLALIFLLILTDYRGILSGEPVTPMIQHNRIHGAVACGFMLIGAFFWMMHNLCHHAWSDWRLRLSVTCTPPIVLLSLLNIFGSKSKGVWMAMAITLPLIYLLAHGYMRARFIRVLGAAMAICLVAGIALFWGNIAQTAGPTINAIGATVQELSNSGDVSSAVHDAIRSEDTPLSMNERMQLWTNAWEIFRTSPVFGQGNDWLESWQKTEYANVGYTLLHNGYLEILVRHGLFGLTVFALLLAVFVDAIRRARRLGLMSLQAAHAYYASIAYFCLTLLSNSNNRLAIGESFFMIVAAIAFHCLILIEIQEKGWPEKKA